MSQDLLELAKDIARRSRRFTLEKIGAAEGPLAVREAEVNG